MYFLTLWVRTQLRQDLLDTTLSDKICQWLAVGRWFSPGTPVSSTIITDRHDITKLLLEVPGWITWSGRVSSFCSTTDTSRVTVKRQHIMTWKSFWATACVTKHTLSAIIFFHLRVKLKTMQILRNYSWPSYNRYHLLQINRTGLFIKQPLEVR